MKRNAAVWSVFVLVFVSTLCFGAPEAKNEVFTTFLAPSEKTLQPTPDAVKEALRRVLTEAGVDRQIREATQNGQFPRRYLLKIAHNNGAGVDGFVAANTGEMPGYIWAVTKTLLDFFTDAAKNPLSETETRLVKHGETMTRQVLALAPSRRKDDSIDSHSASDAASSRPKRVLGLKVIGNTVKLILQILTRLTHTESWNVVGYPAVSNPLIVTAWAELIREWGGEPWVGDESGLESPRTLENMKRSGIYDAVRKGGACLWIFDRGLVADTLKDGFRDAIITSVAGQNLNTYEPATSDWLAGYPGQRIFIPSAIVNGFFTGIFFEAHPKAHTLSVMTGAVKNLVGLMNKESRRDMHNMKHEGSPWGIVNAHDGSSHARIAQTAYAVNRILGREIMGYIGDSISTITAIGPDTGPHTQFQPADRTITFSRNLLWHETATFAISMIAADHVMKSSSRHPRLQFNTYFRGGNPLADNVYGWYSRMALGEAPDLTRGTWHVLGASPDSALITDLRRQLQTHLAAFQIELQLSE